MRINWKVGFYLIFLIASYGCSNSGKPVQSGNIRADTVNGYFLAKKETDLPSSGVTVIEEYSLFPDLNKIESTRYSILPDGSYASTRPKTEYYNEYGQITKSIATIVKDGETQTYRDEYLYNDDRQLSRLDYYSSHHSDRSTIITYQGNAVVQHENLDSLGIVDSVYKWSLGDDGRPESLMVESEGGDFVFTSTFEYDDSKRSVTVRSQVSGWIEYDYDEMGNLDSLTHFNNDGSAQLINTYEYQETSEVVFNRSLYNFRYFRN